MDKSEKQVEELVAKQEKRLQAMRDELRAKYPHAKVETLTFDEAAGNGGKYKVQIVCSICGNEERWVYTSDLFQVNACTECAKKAKAAKKAAKAAEIKEARELIKARKAEATPVAPVAQEPVGEPVGAETK